MVPADVKDTILDRVSEINRVSDTKFSARFRENYIYFDITQSMVTSQYCRIAMNHSDNFLTVQYYNSELSEFVTSEERFNRVVLQEDLDVLLTQAKLNI